MSAPTYAVVWSRNALKGWQRGSAIVLSLDEGLHVAAAMARTGGIPATTTVCVDGEPHTTYFKDYDGLVSYSEHKRKAA